MQLTPVVTDHTSAALLTNLVQCHTHYQLSLPPLNQEVINQR